MLNLLHIFTFDINCFFKGFVKRKKKNLKTFLTNPKIEKTKPVLENTITGDNRVINDHIDDPSATNNNNNNNNDITNNISPQVRFPPPQFPPPNRQQKSRGNSGFPPRFGIPPPLEEGGAGAPELAGTPIVGISPSVSEALSVDNGFKTFLQETQRFGILWIFYQNNIMIKKKIKDVGRVDENSKT